MSTLPGQLVVIKPGALCRLMGSNEESYIDVMRVGLVIQQSHLWRELGSDDEPRPDYLVLFSDDLKLRYVPGSHLLTPDAWSSPDRLFGRPSG